MSAKVIDFYRAKARQLVNRAFKEYGALPGGVVHDLIYVHIHSQETQLAYWKGIRSASMSMEMNKIAQAAIDEGERLINALKVFETEYRDQRHDNDLPYTCI